MPSYRVGVFPQDGRALADVPESDFLFDDCRYATKHEAIAAAQFVHVRELVKNPQHLSTYTTVRPSDDSPNCFWDAISQCTIYLHELAGGEHA